MDVAANFTVPAAEPTPSLSRRHMLAVLVFVSMLILFAAVQQYRSQAPGWSSRTSIPNRAEHAAQASQDSLEYLEKWGQTKPTTRPW